MNNKLKHKFKMLSKLRNREASSTRLLRAIRSLEKEKANVQTNFDRTESNDTEKLEEERAVF